MIPKLSFIIPSYNSYRTIGQTIESLYYQIKSDLLFEVIVVDSSDDQKTKNLLAGYNFDKLKIIASGQKIMPALARNIGAKEASGDFFVFLDADVYLALDFVEKLLFAYDQGYKVGGGSVLLPDSQKSKFIPVAQYFLQCNEYIDIGNAQKRRFLPACNMFCSRILFNQIGGFPQIRASEDTLFGLRANLLSPLWFVPQIRIYHFFREDLKGFLKNQHLLGKYIMIYRRQAYTNKWYYKGLWPLFLLPGFVLIKLSMISSRIFRSRTDLIFKYLYTFPVFILGLLAWAIGFGQGVLHREKE